MRKHMVGRFAATAAVSLMLLGFVPTSAIAEESRAVRFGPFVDRFDDFGTCTDTNGGGLIWAKDSRMTSFAVRANPDGTWHVHIDGADGRFVATGDGPSPNACVDPSLPSTVGNGGRILAGTSGTFRNYADFTEASGTLNPAAVCTAQTFGSLRAFRLTVFGPKSTPMLLLDYCWHYMADSGQLIVDHMAQCSDNRGGFRGDIRSS